jgi:ABC-type uncharacterized transport system YnjBCD substrate-binding protein
VGMILAAPPAGGHDSAMWGLIVTGIVAVSTAVIGYLTNRRQAKATDRSQAMDEVTKVWERLDDLEERLETERRARADLEVRLEAEQRANASWRRNAVNYINLLTAAWGRGGPIPMLPPDLDLD